MLSLIQDVESLSNLHIQLARVADKLANLFLSHIEHHTSNLASEGGLSLSHEREELLTKELLVGASVSGRSDGDGLHSAAGTLSGNGAVSVGALRIAGGHGGHESGGLPHHTGSSRLLVGGPHDLVVGHDTGVEESIGSGVVHSVVVLVVADGGGGAEMLLESGLSAVFLLSKTNVEGLALVDLEVEISDSLGSLVSGGEANKAETLGVTVLIAHNLSGRDGAIGLKHGAEAGVVDVVGEVLDVEVDTLVLVGASGVLLLHLDGSAVYATLRAVLRAVDEEDADLLLVSRNISSFAAGTVLGDNTVSFLGSGLHRLVRTDTLSIHLLPVKLAHCVLSLVSGSIVHAHEGTTVLVSAEPDRRDFTALAEHLTHDILGPVLGEVTAVDVGEVVGFAAGVLSALEKRADVDFLGTDFHAVASLDGALSGLLGLEMNHTVAAALAVLVGDDLAGKDVTKEREGVVQGTVVDGLVEVLDEKVAGGSLAEGRITLRPHDAARSALDSGVIQRIESSLGCRKLIQQRIAAAAKQPADKKNETQTYHQQWSDS